MFFELRIQTTQLGFMEVKRDPLYSCCKWGNQMKMMNFLSPQLLMVQMLKELLGLIQIVEIVFVGFLSSDVCSYFCFIFLSIFMEISLFLFNLGFLNFVSVVQISDCRCIIEVFSGNLGIYFCES